MKTAIYPNRTQISLSNELKSLIEARGNLSNESLSGYLRKSALIRMALEDNEIQENALIAEAVVGKVDITKSGWSKIKNVSSWQRKERGHEESHRS